MMLQFPEAALASSGSCRERKHGLGSAVARVFRPIRGGGIALDQGHLLSVLALAGAIGELTGRRNLRARGLAADPRSLRSFRSSSAASMAKESRPRLPADDPIEMVDNDRATHFPPASVRRRSKAVHFVWPWNCRIAKKIERTRRPPPHVSGVIKRGFRVVHALAISTERACQATARPCSCVPPSRVRNGIALGVQNTRRARGRPGDCQSHRPSIAILNPTEERRGNGLQLPVWLSGKPTGRRKFSNPRPDCPFGFHSRGIAFPRISTALRR